MEAKTVVPSPVQKTMFIGLPRERNAPLAKSPRVESVFAPSAGCFPSRASLMASKASLIISVIPMTLKTALAILF